MHPKDERRTRRVHGAQIKAKVLEECRQPGASVSAVARAHGLDANLVRKWLQGRGLQRAGVKADGGEAQRVALAAAPRPSEAEARQQLFVPVGVTAPRESIEAAATASPLAVLAQPADAAVHVELRRGDSHMAVRWPTTQAAQCAVWLRELAAAMLK